MANGKKTAAKAKDGAGVSKTKVPVKASKYTTVDAPTIVTLPNGKIKTLVPGVDYVNIPDSVKSQL